MPEQRAHRAKGAHRAVPLGKLRRGPAGRRASPPAASRVGVAAGAFGGVAAASSDALPGDSLYGLKRGMEDFKLDTWPTATPPAAASTSTRRPPGSARPAASWNGAAAAHLDHESLGEIRRALTGMQHDASEGHRLLHEAYEKDTARWPRSQTLVVVLRARTGRPGAACADRLPVQLTDVGNQVSRSSTP